MHNNRLIHIVLFIFLVQPLLSQEISVTSKLDTNAMLIGDQVGFHIGITVPARSVVRWPAIGDTILGHIRVLNRSKIDTSWSPDKTNLSLTQSFLLTTFDSGYYAIPPVPFYVQQPPDTSRNLRQSGPAFLYVHTVHVDTTVAIKPIKGPIKIPISFREMLPWIIAGLLVFAVIVFFVYWLKKRKKAEPIFRLRPQISIPPHEKALIELEKLKGKKLWQNGKIKDYHTELTEIIRKYIEERFGVMAMEMTSDEIIDLLSDGIGISESSIDRLVRIFTTADLVKFAKSQPLPSEHELSMEEAFSFVKDTILRIVEQKESLEAKETVMTQ